MVLSEDLSCFCGFFIYFLNMRFIFFFGELVYQIIVLIKIENKQILNIINLNQRKNLQIFQNRIE